MPTSGKIAVPIEACSRLAVRGDHIACLCAVGKDGAGQCRHIPAHPSLDVPSTIKVLTYLSQERYGIIWATRRRISC